MTKNGNFLERKKSMKIRRNVKDSVFTHLFSIPKYRRELYLSLHPEDANIGEDEIESVTLSNVLSSGLYNDLGIYVKKRLIILVEAQSIWTENILWRMLYYLAESTDYAQVLLHQPRLTYHILSR